METTLDRELCPRCEGQFGDKYPGISRLDNSTVICNPCEIDEAMEDFFGPITPMNVWPVKRAWAVKEIE